MAKVVPGKPAAWIRAGLMLLKAPLISLGNPSYSHRMPKFTVNRGLILKSSWINASNIGGAVSNEATPRHPRPRWSCGSSGTDDVAERGRAIDAHPAISWPGSSPDQEVREGTERQVVRPQDLRLRCPPVCARPQRRPESYAFRGSRKSGRPTETGSPLDSRGQSRRNRT